MDLVSISTIKSLLKKHRTTPKKHLGQNFLINRSVLEKILETAQIKPEDIVVEIGSGFGTLTIEIADICKKVIAVEKDKNLIEILNEIIKTSGSTNIVVASQDALEFNPSKYKSYNLIGNIPYHITSPLIRKFLETENQPSQMVLMVQKEVAERICAKPPKMSLLAVSVQFYATPEIIEIVPRSSFWPEPEVDSAIINIRLHNKNREIDRKLFFKIVKAGFLSPRKQLANNLSNGLKINRETVKRWLERSGVEPAIRAETLIVEEWIRLLNHH